MKFLKRKNKKMKEVKLHKMQIWKCWYHQFSFQPKLKENYLVKYLEIVVVAVCDIIPWPENLIKKIATNKKTIDEIFEKKKHENERSRVTKKANLKIFISSIFFPTQINKKLLSKVADA